jgi:hypothetical protein
MLRSFRPAVAVAGLALTLGLAAAGPARADDDNVGVGLSIGYSTRFDSAVYAADFLVGLNRAFSVVPTVSFTEAHGVHRWTAGAELQWNAPAHRLQRHLQAWAGGGMVVLTEDPKGPADATTRDLIATGVVGFGYDLPAAPFVQARFSLGGPAEVVIAAGVRF